MWNFKGWPLNTRWQAIEQIEVKTTVIYYTTNVILSTLVKFQLDFSLDNPYENTLHFPLLNENKKPWGKTNKIFKNIYIWTVYLGKNLGSYKSIPKFR